MTKLQILMKPEKTSSDMTSACSAVIYLSPIYLKIGLKISFVALNS